ncbi:Histone chaperone asf1 [Tritrichomonas musculus]|uniref:Histone chaperone asf1 n=1 Tax=Tritrichomonas musculus TaxID=1915356 RepID=A0ABR2GLI5_9EUKA
MKWEVDFVASLHEYDQVLASTLVGPISVGINRFALRADPPKLDDLPSDEVKLAALLVKAFYNDQEFYRIGYMVAHDYPPDIPHDNLDIKQLNRYISVDEDFITRKKTQINWT